MWLFGDAFLCSSIGLHKIVLHFSLPLGQEVDIIENLSKIDSNTLKLRELSYNFIRCQGFLDDTMKVLVRLTRVIHAPLVRM